MLSRHKTNGLFLLQAEVGFTFPLNNTHRCFQGSVCIKKLLCALVSKQQLWCQTAADDSKVFPSAHTSVLGLSLSDA